MKFCATYCFDLEKQRINVQVFVLQLMWLNSRLIGWAKRAYWTTKYREMSHLFIGHLNHEACLCFNTFGGSVTSVLRSSKELHEVFSKH